MGSSRQEKDKLTKSTSVKFTEEQLSKLKNKTEGRGMSVSDYVRRLVDLDESETSPKVKVKVQDIVNIAVEIAGDEHKNQAEALQKEADALWQL